MRTRATIVSAMISLGLGFSLPNIGAVAETIEAAYAISLATVGLFTTAVSLTHSLGQIPGGGLVDRFGAKRIAILGTTIVCTANAIALIAPEPALAIPCRALIGVGTSMAFVAASIYVREVGAVAQGVFGGAGLAGAGIAIAIMPPLADPLGWRGPWIMALIVSGIALALTLIGPPGPKRVTRAEVPGAPSARRVFRDPAIYRLAAMHMAGMGLSIVVANWVVTLLTRAGDYSEDTAGLIGSIALLLGLITRPYGGWIFRHRPHLMRPALALSIVLSAAGTVAVAVAGPVWLSLLGTIVIGAAAGIPFAPAFTGAALRYPATPGVAVGFVNMLGNGVVVAGAPLLGLAFSLPGDGRIGYLVVAGIWLSALLAIPSMKELGLERAPAEPAGGPVEQPEPAAPGSG